MSRYREITPAEMTPAQRRVHDQIVAGRRGRFGGPFQLLIRAPEICGHAVTARRASALGHLAARSPLRAGDHHHRALLAGAIRMVRARAAGREGRRPARGGRGDPPRRNPEFRATDEALVHRVCTELFHTQRLSDASFAEAIATLGEAGLVEVIAIIGYYTLIGNTLNVFQVPVPDGERHSTFRRIADPPISRRRSSRLRQPALEQLAPGGGQKPAGRAAARPR